MGSARSILQQAGADLALLESNIPLNDLDRQAFLNALDEATNAIATALGIIAPDEDSVDRKVILAQVKKSL